MTSQKRYRHHDSKSISRFRDIPPRFKRQKSSSSPKPETEDISVNQENEVVQSISNWSESDQRVMSPSHHAWQHQEKSDSNVISQMDNQYCNYNSSGLNISSQSRYVSPPPLYTWQTTYTSQPGTPFAQHRLYSQEALLSGHNGVPPALKMAQVQPDKTWPGFLQIEEQGKSRPLAVRSPPLQTQRNSNPPLSAVDYFDPDIRTIEMLRELERVADEKEQEDMKDPTLDSKNLVSHHLRMLMCAVDRYTEGVQYNESPTDTQLSPVKGRNTNDKQFPPIQQSFQAARDVTKKQASPRVNSPTTTVSPRNHYLDQQSNFQHQIPQEESLWQPVTYHTNKKASKANQASSPVSKMYPPNQSKTPHQVHEMITLAPSQSHSSGMLSLPGQKVSPHQSRTPSPFMPQLAKASSTPPHSPLRAIIGYNNKQNQTGYLASQSSSQFLFPNNDQVNPGNIHCTSFSSASVESTMRPTHQPSVASVWGPAKYDRPSDARSWDLWSGPSIFNDIYKVQSLDEPRIIATNDNCLFFPKEQVYMPVDMKEHLPLYRR